MATRWATHPRCSGPRRAALLGATCLVATLGLVCCCYSLLALAAAESNTSGGWTFTEVVGGDLRTCSVRNDDVDDATPTHKQAGGGGGGRNLFSFLLADSWSSRGGDGGGGDGGTGQHTCRLAADPLARLEAGLRGLAGQEKAADKLKAALFRHTWDRPLAFHFAGESGVGKTSTARLLARALYAGEDHNEDGRPPPGLLVLDGEYFDSKASDKIEEYREHISREIIRQLQRCPRSIIVFDEMELVDPRTLTIVEPFLDNRFVSYKGIAPSSPLFCPTPICCQSANAGQAIFIFISNSITLDPGLTDQETESAMRSSMAKAWGDRKKIGSLVQNMVPFRRLDEAALREVVRARLEGLVTVYGQREGLQRVCYSHRVLTALVSEVLRRHPRTNARGVDLVFNPTVAEPLLTRLQTLDERAQLREMDRRERRKADEEEREREEIEEDERRRRSAYAPDRETTAPTSRRGAGVLKSAWRAVAQPLDSLQAQLSRSSHKAASLISDLVFSTPAGEWRGEFEANLYFPQAQAQPQAHERSSSLVLELKELTTGTTLRTEVCQLGPAPSPATRQTSPEPAGVTKDEL